MNKSILLSLLILCTTFSAIAQPEKGKFRFSAGPEIGYVSGTYSEHWNLGAGGSLQPEYFLSNHVSITVFGGFIGYLGGNANVPGYPGLKYHAFNVIPVKSGIRYYIGESFHIGAQLGAGFIDNGAGHATAFAYSPVIGYNFQTNNYKGIDFSIKYDGYAFNQKNIPNGYGGTFSAIGIRLAYIF